MVGAQYTISIFIQGPVYSVLISFGSFLDHQQHATLMVIIDPPRISCGFHPISIHSSAGVGVALLRIGRPRQMELAYVPTFTIIHPNKNKTNPQCMSMFRSHLSCLLRYVYRPGDADTSITLKEAWRGEGHAPRDATCVIRINTLCP